jgi:hypothetical protein
MARIASDFYPALPEVAVCSFSYRNILLSLLQAFPSFDKAALFVTVLGLSYGFVWVATDHPVQVTRPPFQHATEPYDKNFVLMINVRVCASIEV